MSPATPKKRRNANKDAPRKPRKKANRAALAADNGRPEELAPIGFATIRNRMRFVGIGLALALAIATGRAVMFQTVDAATLQAEAARNYVRSETLDDWRGDIVDRNGDLLAVTVHRWSVIVDPTQITRPAETAAALAPILGMSATDVHERIDPATARPTDEDDARNPATQLAREMTTPMARLLTHMWQAPGLQLDRRVDLLEKFFQLDQLQHPAIFDIVDKVAEAAEVATDAIHADVDALRFFPSRGRRFAYIARDLEDAAIRAINVAREAHATRCREARDRGERCHNPLAAVTTRPEPRRYYPKRQLAAPVLGLVGRDGGGLSGVERAMDPLLRGGRHTVRTIKDQHGREIFLEGIPADAPLAAPSIELTLDQQIQAITERELAKACLSSGARAGYAVVMRVETGEILAVANFPTFNPNTFQDWFRDRQPLKDERLALAQRRRELAFAAEWAGSAAAYPGSDQLVLREAIGSLDAEYDAYIEYQHRYPNASRNAAFLDVYEPGSIMKVFTVAAALEEKVVALEDVFELHNGDWELHDADDNVIHDVSRLSSGTIADIIKKSSNIGAGKIGFILGADALDRYLRDFGFGGPTRSGFPGEARGLLRPAAEWVPVELANVSFGQGLAVTGVQLVMALGALANEGKLMRPLLIRRVVDADGREISRWDPEVVRQVVSPKTARTVIDLMQGVVAPDGTGRRAYIPEYPVAGKTGTGQKPHLRMRGYSEAMWVNTFFGVAPADDPELAIVVLIDEPTGKRHGGGLIAAPTFREIMSRALPIVGVPSPYATVTRQAWLDPDALAARRAAPPVHHDPLDALAPPVDDSQGGDVPVPDFRGQTMDTVRRQAAELGLPVRLYGTGLALSQDVAPHDRVSRDTVVTVVFRSRLGVDEAPVMTPEDARNAPLPPLPPRDGGSL